MSYNYGNSDHETGVHTTEDGRVIPLLKMEITVAEYKELVGKAAVSDAEICHKAKEITEYKQLLYTALRKLENVGEIFLDGGMKELLDGLKRDPSIDRGADA